MRKSAKEQDTIVVAATGASKGKPEETIVKVMEVVEETLNNPVVDVVETKAAPKKAKSTNYKKVDAPKKPVNHAKPKTKADKPKKAAPVAKPKTKEPSLVKEIDDSAKEAMAAVQREETVAVFDAANRWALREDLTPLERCHGTAHEVYTMDHPLTENGMKQQHARHDSYAQHYDQHFGGEIESRRIRAARELFPN